MRGKPRIEDCTIVAVVLGTWFEFEFWFLTKRIAMRRQTKEKMRDLARGRTVWLYGGEMEGGMEVRKCCTFLDALNFSSQRRESAPR
jgi:hypothetical protein